MTLRVFFFKRACGRDGVSLLLISREAEFCVSNGRVELGAGDLSEVAVMLS